MYEPGLHVPLLVRGPGVRPGAATALFALNTDLAPTMLEFAGLPVPSDMHGRSLLPILRGGRPADWRTSVYYRYYNDPGFHNTRAHYGVRTATHKLIHYFTKNAWELFDLVRDPTEQRNLAADPAQRGRLAELKVELARLQRELGDTPENVRGSPRSGPRLPADLPELGDKSVTEAIAAAGG